MLLRADSAFFSFPCHDIDVFDNDSLSKFHYTLLFSYLFLLNFYIHTYIHTYIFSITQCQGSKARINHVPISSLTNIPTMHSLTLTHSPWSKWSPLALFSLERWKNSHTRETSCSDSNEWAMISWFARRFKNGRTRGGEGCVAPERRKRQLRSGLEWMRGQNGGYRLSQRRGRGQSADSSCQLTADPTRDGPRRNYRRIAALPTLRCPHSATLHRAPRPDPIYIRVSRFSSRFADPAERGRALSPRELCGLLLLAIFKIIWYVCTSCH